jgi:hypothetical protein
MTKYLSILCLTLGLVSCDPKQIQSALDLLNSSGGTSFSVADGLKQALEVGVDTSVKKLSAQGGYMNSVYKILLPEDAQKVINVVKKVPGFDNIEQRILSKINESAEDAAKKAAPIFVSAIRGMTFADATDILMGNQNAATTYLHNKTYNPLYGEFKPVIVNSLNKFGALDLWADVVETYNKIPLLQPLNPDMADHVTGTALKGLFSLIEVKEKGIRTDVTQRTTDLLKDVFAKQDKK